MLTSYGSPPNSQLTNTADDWNTRVRYPAVLAHFLFSPESKRAYPPSSDDSGHDGDVEVFILRYSWL
jgi:hypothetical protein